ncbi:N-acetyltransferase [Candidatus Bathycorpusculum sp.]|jgi:ribosomal-protein-alanine N-acetyltransferase|uniref:N-acetyltransferase n=1 Tax=Candidatus Bathycorpusculum sp. TaxID=2994959 RepID=UPI0028199CC9|nr:GNAT family N-acetyltransferase [Candidatus Termitimicrobium sp.]MCL2432312.1 GNAT family N-acetyltransferase [Candidatus Termitimicrobium sp.]
MMQQTFTLRKFSPGDLQNVIQINRVCLPENYTDFFFVDLHQRFPETFIVAEHDEKILGYIMCRIEVGLSNFGFGGLVRKGHVVSIAVLPQYRRRGVAQAIINRALEGMEYYKAKQGFLEVRVTNEAAISLYKKLEFEITRTINGYYSDGEDAYVMTKKIA